MKRTVVILTAVLSVLGFAILYGAPKAQLFNSSAAIAAPAPTPAPMAVPMPNRCPNINAALESLKSADKELRDSNHDFCGHKEIAIRAVSTAIEQLALAERCEKCR